jgi:hypothetical protein
MVFVELLANCLVESSDNILSFVPSGSRRGIPLCLKSKPVPCGVDHRLVGVVLPLTAGPGTPKQGRPSGWDVV